MTIDWDNTVAAIWRSQKQQLRAVHHHRIDPITLDSLLGIEKQKQQLIVNTERFINKKPANNVLLWGARGTGKSSLIKALLNHYKDAGLRLIEIYKNDLHNLPEIVDEIRDVSCRFIIYCDDFSFDNTDSSYIVLKTVLEGSIEQPPENVLLYTTSNRRHLLPESIQDNFDTKLVDGTLHYSDAVEEKISLSDRFGLWISFYPIKEAEYLAIVDSYFADAASDQTARHEAALLFAHQRGARSGRTAKQFYNFYCEQEN